MIDKNSTTTRDILCNNIHGSFIVILWRERDKSKFDFIDKLRISAYHHIILKEQNRFTFPDIMENFGSCNQQEFQFNNMDDQYGDSDYWLGEREIKESGYTPDQVYNNYVEILENKSTAIINSKIPLFKKICAYKIHVMKGENLPIYGAQVVMNRFKKFDLLSGDDILKDMKIKKQYFKTMKGIM